jgi:hypothetical protein
MTSVGFFMFFSLFFSYVFIIPIERRRSFRMRARREAFFSPPSYILFFDIIA